ncbi:conserved Plasmodium membrane protein, unknown function [Plasmodium gaboni]|uniref:PCIF1 WW domain-containing protein n=1 Tax=Plasmodium gaboni TaxID=647221 RepID=A0ABY1ULB3_9APIC|nr:conserved Plasmodium membrane protein, unknown function [Plasmodium gaboni]
MMELCIKDEYKLQDEIIKLRRSLINIFCYELFYSPNKKLKNKLLDIKRKDQYYNKGSFLFNGEYNNVYNYDNIDDESYLCSYKKYRHKINKIFKRFMLKKYTYNKIKKKENDNNINTYCELRKNICFIEKEILNRSLFNINIKYSNYDIEKKYMYLYFLFIKFMSALKTKKKNIIIINNNNNNNNKKNNNKKNNNNVSSRHNPPCCNHSFFSCSYIKQFALFVNYLLNRKKGNIYFELLKGHIKSTMNLKIHKNKYKNDNEHLYQKKYTNYYHDIILYKYKPIIKYEKKKIHKNNIYIYYYIKYPVQKKNCSYNFSLHRYQKYYYIKYIKNKIHDVFLYSQKKKKNIYILSVNINKLKLVVNKFIYNDFYYNLINSIFYSIINIPLQYVCDTFIYYLICYDTDVVNDDNSLWSHKEYNNNNNNNNYNYNNNNNKIDVCYIKRHNDNFIHFLKYFFLSSDQYKKDIKNNLSHSQRSFLFYFINHIKLLLKNNIKNMLYLTLSNVDKIIYNDMSLEYIFYLFLFYFIFLDIKIYSTIFINLDEEYLSYEEIKIFKYFIKGCTDHIKKNNQNHQNNQNNQNNQNHQNNDIFNSYNKTNVNKPTNTYNNKKSRDFFHICLLCSYNMLNQEKIFMIEKIKIFCYITYYILYINHFSCDKNEYDSFLHYFLFYNFKKKKLTWFNIYPLFSNRQKWLHDEYNENLFINYDHTCCHVTKKKIQRYYKKYLIKLFIDKKYKCYKYIIKLLNEEEQNITYFKKDIFKNKHRINQYNNISYNKNNSNENIYNNFINKNSFLKHQKVYAYNKETTYNQQQFYNYIIHMFSLFYENLKLFLLRLLQNIYHNTLIYINVYMYLYMIRSYYLIQRHQKIKVKNLKYKIYKKYKKYYKYNNTLLINYSSERHLANIKDITCIKKKIGRKVSNFLKYTIINLFINLYNNYLFILNKIKVKKCTIIFLTKYMKLLLYIGRNILQIYTHPQNYIQFVCKLANSVNMYIYKYMRCYNDISCIYSMKNDKMKYKIMSTYILYKFFSINKTATNMSIHNIKKKKKKKLCKEIWSYFIKTNGNHNIYLEKYIKKILLYKGVQKNVFHNIYVHIKEDNFSIQTKHNFIIFKLKCKEDDNTNTLQNIYYQINGKKYFVFDNLYKLKKTYKINYIILCLLFYRYCYFFYTYNSFIFSYLFTNFFCICIDCLNKYIIIKNCQGKKKETCQDNSHDCFYKQNGILKKNRNHILIKNFYYLIFFLLIRYHTIIGSISHSGLQNCIPKRIMNVLKKYMNVNVECFSSPFNSVLECYCSFFSDIDIFFGSKGDFFKYTLQSGVYEVNPPFDIFLINKLIIYILFNLKMDVNHLTFFLIIPYMKDINYYYELLFSSPYLSHFFLLQRNTYTFSTRLFEGRENEYISTCDCFVFILQNKKAQIENRVHKKKVLKIKKLWQNVDHI